MFTQNLLYKRSYPINDYISIVIPSVIEILENEDNYYSLVSALTAMPIDLMVQLDDAGIDFDLIDEYDLFLLMFDYIRKQDTRLIFGDLDLSNFNMSINEVNGAPVLRDEKNDITIDRAIHRRISNFLRGLHHIEKNYRKPANSEAKKFMLERAREKMKRKRHRTEVSQLETLIIAMVNTEQYKYNYEETKSLSIYQFNESVRQIIKKIDYDNRMRGVYAGTVDVKGLSQDDLNWLVHK